MIGRIQIMMFKAPVILSLSSGVSIDSKVENQLRVSIKYAKINLRFEGCFWKRMMNSSYEIALVIESISEDYEMKSSIISLSSSLIYFDKNVL